jgi:glycosyltransferase involved in cell wall biosynthesis
LSSAVAILQSSYNGARFLEDQLRSFEYQSHRNWLLINADDGSTDATLRIFREFQNRIGFDRAILQQGPRRGFVINFLSLISDERITADYYAFSDQDDIWEPDKLENALKWLGKVPASVPGLYCSRTRLIDEAGRAIGFSPLFRKPPSFANALVQNIAGGNTMVFNEAARQLLKAGGIVDVPSHDWWLYLLVSGVEGAVFYDRYCSVRYRCHPNNVVGSNLGIRPRILRAKMLLEGKFRRWTDMYLAAIEACSPPLTPRSRATLEAFRKARREGLLARVSGMHRSGVYRQTRLGNIGLFVGTVLNKI